VQTQVGIVGAGPAGLLLGQILHLHGIDSVIVENRSREYTIERVRAGVIEQGTVDLMNNIGTGERMNREGLRHDGIYLAFNGNRHRVDMAGFTGGKAIMVYGQNEIAKDLVEARLKTGRPLIYEVENTSIHGLDTTHPRIRYRKDGQEQEIECDFIAGCDGFHGICRPAIPSGTLKIFERVYPFGWLGILAEAAPSSPELVYTYHDRGFALFSMRSPKITRLYFQVPPEEDIDKWSDDQIWEEMLARMTSRDGWKPNIGKILQKGVTPMRSFVAEPMRYGRMFLAGDSAHIVPPTGAKGLNLAAADVAVLSQALKEFYKTGSEKLLEEYSSVALRRVWKYQRFSWWMTSLLHRFPNEVPFDYRRQVADLDYITGSKAALTSLSENYVGLPMDVQTDFM